MSNEVFMLDHDAALEILSSARQKYLQSAISLVRKARHNSSKKDLIIKHANDFHRAKAKSLLYSINTLKKDRTKKCACCMNTGYIKGTNEYEIDVICPYCKGVER